MMLYEYVKKPQAGIVKQKKFKEIFPEEMSSKLNSEWQEMVSIPEKKQGQICQAKRAWPVWGSTRKPSKVPS